MQCHVDLLCWRHWSCILWFQKPIFIALPTVAADGWMGGWMDIKLIRLIEFRVSITSVIWHSVLFSCQVGLVRDRVTKNISAFNVKGEGENYFNNIVNVWVLILSENEDNELMKKKESDLLELQKLQQKLDQLSQSSSSCQKDVLQPIAHQSLLSLTGVYLQCDLLVCMWGGVHYKSVFSSWYFPVLNYSSYHP